MFSLFLSRTVLFFCTVFGRIDFKVFRSILSIPGIPRTTLQLESSMDELRVRSLGAALLAISCAACEVVGLGGGTKYEGAFSGPMNHTMTSGITCATTYDVTGRVEIELDDDASGSNASGEGTIFVTARPGPPSPSTCGTAPNRNWDGGGNFSRPASDIRFDHEYTVTGPMTVVTKSSFAGALVNGEITGTVTLSWTGTGLINPPTVTNESASATFNVNLRK